MASLVAPGLRSPLVISHQDRSDRVVINENRYDPPVRDSTSDPLDPGDVI